MKAIWKDKVIAESKETIVIEGNHYFPPNSIHKEFFIESDTHTVCPWKGTASYNSIKVGDKVNPDAAWYYPKVSSLASKIEGYYAFWKGIEVIE